MIKGFAPKSSEEHFSNSGRFVGAPVHESDLDYHLNEPDSRKNDAVIATDPADNLMRSFGAIASGETKHHASGQSMPHVPCDAHGVNSLLIDMTKEEPEFSGFKGGLWACLILLKFAYSKRFLCAKGVVAKILKIMKIA
jgi:hypothetical protein